MGSSVTLEQFLKKNKSDIIVPGERTSGVLSTGSIRLDASLGGGLRRGKLSQFWGPNHGGKTTIALRTAGEILRQGGTVFWFDLEESMDFGTNLDGELSEEQKRQLNWMKINGVDPEDENFIIFRWLSAETILDRVIEGTHNDLFDLAVVDTIAGMRTESQVEGDLSDSHYGAIAKLQSSGLPALMRAFSWSEEQRGHVMFINQVRDKINSRYGGKKPYGGNAVRHYAHYSIFTQKYGKSNHEDDGEVVSKSIVKIEKNKYAPLADLEIQFSSKFGVDVGSELIDFGIWAGYVHKAGSWYTLMTEPMSETEVDALKDTGELEDDDRFFAKVQGSNAAKLALLGTDLGERLKEEALAGSRTRRLQS